MVKTIPAICYAFVPRTAFLQIRTLHVGFLDCRPEECTFDFRHLALCLFSVSLLVKTLQPGSDARNGFFCGAVLRFAAPLQQLVQMRPAPNYRIDPVQA